jgi:Etoposide-induced protein 2.4 (EI24)
MGLLFDSFWRAVAYCLHPRVIALSLLPLVLMGALASGLAWFGWDRAVGLATSWLTAVGLDERLAGVLRSLGADRLKAMLAPLIVIFLTVPLIVVLSLLAVAFIVTPSVVRLIAQRRFPLLERKLGGSLLGSVLWSLGSVALALLALVMSVPLWFLPPLVLILPPLIWGWLTYRVMAYDALAEHASREERLEILRRHRPWLIGMGVLAGYLGAAPGLVWAMGALFAVTFLVFLIPVAVWIYTLVFAFSSLWFTHYTLSALQQLRAETGIRGVPPSPAPAPIEPKSIAWRDESSDRSPILPPG